MTGLCASGRWRRRFRPRSGHRATVTSAPASVRRTRAAPSCRSAAWSPSNSASSLPSSTGPSSPTGVDGPRQQPQRDFGGQAVESSPHRTRSAPFRPGLSDTAVAATDRRPSRSPPRRAATAAPAWRDGGRRVPRRRAAASGRAAAAAGSAGRGLRDRRQRRSRPLEGRKEPRLRNIQERPHDNGASSTGHARVIAPSPVIPLPRIIRNSTVSA